MQEWYDNPRNYKTIIVNPPRKSTTLHTIPLSSLKLVGEIKICAANLVKFGFQIISVVMCEVITSFKVRSLIPIHFF